MSKTVPSSRRDFLSRSAAAAAIVHPLLSGALLSRPFAAEDSGEPVGFPLGVQSYSFRKFPVLEAINRAAALGLDFIEFFPGHFPMDAEKEKAAEIMNACQQAGLNLPAYGVVGFGPDEAKNRAAFEFARRTGIGTLTANPTRESLAGVEALAKEFDVRVAIHNHGPGSMYSAVDDVLGAVAGRDPRLGGCVDTGHFLRSHQDPAGAIRLLGDRVHAVHLKDIRSHEDHTNVINGRGILDLAATLTALRETGFDGPLAVEYEAEPENPDESIRECIAEVRKT